MRDYCEEEGRAFCEGKVTPTHFFLQDPRLLEISRGFFPISAREAHLGILRATARRTRRVDREKTQAKKKKKIQGRARTGPDLRSLGFVCARGPRKRSRVTISLSLSLRGLSVQCGFSVGAAGPRAAAGAAAGVGGRGAAARRGRAWRARRWSPRGRARSTRGAGARARPGGTPRGTAGAPIAPPPPPPPPHPPRPAGLPCKPATLASCAVGARVGGPSALPAGCPWRGLT